jgi:hypothetical protein
MATKDLPSPDVLRQLLRYEPDTGKLFWRKRGPEWFLSLRSWKRWNTCFADRMAMNQANTHGYMQGTLLSRKEQAHTVIWIMQTGRPPKVCIDHKDGCRSNNRWDNLREATVAENNRNRRLNGSSASGVKGVTWNKARSKWQARIVTDGTHVFLGLFETVDGARKAYRSASCNLHGAFVRNTEPGIKAHAAALAVTPDETALRTGDLVIRQRDVACGG